MSTIKEVKDDPEMGESPTPSVAQLASEAPSGRKVTKAPFLSRISLPMGLFAVIILVINVVAVTLPMGLVMTAASKSGLESLSDKLLEEAVVGAVAQINTYLAEPHRAVQTLVNYPPLVNTLINNSNNLESEQDLFSLIMSSLANAENLDSIVFATSPGIAPVMTTTVPTDLGDTTVMGVILPLGIGLWYDRSTPSQMQRHIDPATTLFTGTAQPQPDAVEDNAQFQRLLLPNPEPVYWSIWPLTFGGPTTLLLTYAQMIYPPNAAPGTRPWFTSVVTMRTEGNVDLFLAQLKPTPGTIAILVEDTGDLISTSIPASAAASGVRYKITECPDADVTRIGKALIGRFGAISKMDAAWAGTIEKGNGNDSFLVRSQQMVFGTLSMRLIVAVPRADIYANIDKGFRNSTVIAVVVAVIVTTLGAIALNLMAKPLQTLTSGMKQITKFDFSIIGTGILAHRSIVTEYRAMEEVFDTMCKAFAAAIQRNRALVAGTRHGSQSSTGQEPLIAQTTAPPTATRVPRRSVY